MLHDLRLTPAQVAAIAEWVVPHAGMANVELAQRRARCVEVAQGDDRVTIAPDGRHTAASVG